MTFDLNADVAKQIKDGTILFSVDQQPYLQGYMAVDSLWFYLTNRNDLGGGLPVLTGPSFVDSTQHRRHPQVTRPTTPVESDALRERASSLRSRGTSPA